MWLKEDGEGFILPEVLASEKNTSVQVLNDESGPSRSKAHTHTHTHTHTHHAYTHTPYHIHTYHYHHTTPTGTQEWIGMPRLPREQQ